MRLLFSCLFERLTSCGQPRVCLFSFDFFSTEAYPLIYKPGSQLPARKSFPPFLLYFVFFTYGFMPKTYGIVPKKLPCGILPKKLPYGFTPNSRGPSRRGSPRTFGKMPTFSAPFRCGRRGRGSLQRLVVEELEECRSRGTAAGEVFVSELL